MMTKLNQTLHKEQEIKETIGFEGIINNRIKIETEKINDINITKTNFEELQRLNNYVITNKETNTKTFNDQLFYNVTLNRFPSFLL